MLTASPSSLKHMARIYTLKSIAFSGVAAFLGASVVGVMLGSIVKWDYWVPLLLALGPAIGSTIGGAIPTYMAYRNLLDVNYEGSSKVDQIRRVTFYLPYHTAFQLCLDSLAVFGSYRVLLADQGEGQIEVALVPDPFWKTLFNGAGLRISFRLSSNQQGMTDVTVASKATLGTVRIDLGFNKRNVSKILAYFESKALPIAH